MRFRDYEKIITLRLLLNYNKNRYHTLIFLPKVITQRYCD